MIQKHITASTFDYKHLEQLNAYLLEHAEKIVDNGVMFFEDKIVVQVVEGFDPDDFSDVALRSLRKALDTLVVKRLALETDRQHWARMQLKVSAPLAPRFCEKCHQHMNQPEVAADMVSQRVQENAQAIEETEQEMKYTRERIKEIKDGKFEIITH